MCSNHIGTTMSLKFTELNKDGPRKSQKQILEEITRTLRPRIPKDMRRSYFYDGSSHGEQAHYELSVLEEEFDDVPF